MNRILFLAFSFSLVATLACSSVSLADGSDSKPGSTSKQHSDTKGDGWHELFNGKDLEGWKASENTDTFSVVDGDLVAKGKRSHLFYVGPVSGGKFKNFEWKCEVMCKPNSNSGMYFHTEFQDKGWPEKGYEVQINNTHGDGRKTGGLYAVADVMDNSPAKDGEWFTQHVIVKDKHVIIKVNDSDLFGCVESHDGGSCQHLVPNERNQNDIQCYRFSKPTTPFYVVTTHCFVPLTT